MKKIYLFMLLVLTFIGAGMAWAALVPDSDPEASRLLEVKDGDQFFLRAEYNSGQGGDYWDNGCRWISLRTPYEKGKETLVTVETNYYQVTDEGLFTVESAGQTIKGADGKEFAAYYLKNVESGLYITEGTYRDANSSFLKFTAEKEEAIIWGFRPVSDLIADNPFTEGKWFIFMVNANNSVLYLNGGNLVDPEQNLQVPYYGGWTDAPGWFDLIPAADETVDIFDQVLKLAEQAIAYGSENDEGGHIIYGGIGGYADDIVAMYNDVMKLDFDSEDFYNMSDEELVTLRDRLEALVLLLLDAKLQLPEEGYYQIISAYTPWATEQRAVYADGKIVKWNLFEGQEANPAYIWHFTQKEDGKYRIQSLSEGTLFTVCVNNGSAELTVDEEFGSQLITLGNAQFNIRIGTGNGNDVHPKGHSEGAGTEGTITGYPGGRDTQSAWRLVAVSEDVYGPYVEEMERKLIEAKGEDAKDQEVAKVQEELLAKIAEVGAATKSAFEYELPDDAVNITPLSADDFESNAAMSAEHGYSWGNDGGGYAALIDGSTDSFFHTYWGGNNNTIQWSAYDDAGQPTEWATRTTLHNLSMKLAQPSSDVTFQINTRSGAVRNPIKVDVDASHDGKTWTTVFYGYDFFTPLQDPATPYLIGPFDMGEAYEYVRFSNYRNDYESPTGNNNHYFCFSELKVFQGARLKSTCQAATMDQTVVADFLKAYSNANKYADLVSYEEIDDIKAALNNLQAAYEAFLGVFADPTALKNAIATGESIVNNFVVGDNILGMYDGSETPDELEDAIDKGQELLEAGHYTEASLNAAEKEINDAIAKLNATLVQPDPNKWYQFVFPSEAEYDANPTWARGEAEMNGQGEAALYDRVAAIMNGDENTLYEDYSTIRAAQSKMWAVHESTISANPEISYFRILQVEEGKYVIQNKATGLYVGSLPHGSQPLMDTTPGLFDIDYMGAGCTIMSSQDFWTGEYRNGNKGESDSFHFAWVGPNQVQGWNDHAIGTKSSLHVREVSGSEGPAEFFGDALPNGAYAITNFNDVQNIDGGNAYTVAGIYKDIYTYGEDEPLLFVGLKEMELPIPAGTPFILVASKPSYVLSLGSDFTKEALWTAGLRGLFQGKAAEVGTGILKNETVDDELVNFFQVIEGTVTGNVAPFSAYLATQNEGDLPEGENESDFDLLIVVRGDLNTTGIATLPSKLQLSGNVYNMAGQRVGTANDLRSLKRGIYVINGRKVLIQ